jgi:hypothetical protein
METKMYYKFQKVYAPLLKLFLVGTLLVVSVGCDSILSDEFEAKEFRDTPAIDARACQNLLIEDTLLVADSLTHRAAYVTPARFNIVNSRNLSSLVDSITGARLDSETISEKQVIYSNFTALTDSLNPVLRDSLMLVTYPDGRYTTYAVLKVLPGQSKDYYIYTSLNYYDEGASGSNNIHEYVDVRLIRSDTTIVDYTEDMTLETATASVQTIEIPGGTKLVPTITGRRKVHVEEGVTYFVRFIISNPDALSSIRTADGLKFFKVLILSL